MRRGLEIYDLHGNQLGQYALPGQSPAWLDDGWLRVDEHGRIFLPDASGSVVILQDPTAPTAQCPELPSVIELAAEDTPPQTYSAELTW